MSGALKWSPFDSSRWPSATEAAGRTPAQFPGPTAMEASAGRTPVQVEEYVEKQTLVVRAEIPGADPDRDIEVAVAGGLLHIRAERHGPDDRPGGERLASGLRYLPFTRSVPLPAGVTDRDIKVSYREGVLEVRTPLPAAPPTDAKERRLTISHD